MIKIEFRKKHSIPQLDFKKLEISSHKRRNSDSELISDRSIKRKNIDEVIQKHKEACSLIKEIHSHLDKIKKISCDENSLGECLKELKDIVDGLDSKDTPRLLSRCDALVGNTRLTLENTQSIISNSRQTIKYLKTVDEEAEQHDIITVTILNDILKEMSEMKHEMNKLNKKLDLLVLR